MEAKLIEREGPTGLICTTTAVSLHPENETRLLSLPVDDSTEQTKAVMRAIATENGAPVDLSEWHALQLWLADGERRVTVRFAGYLYDHIPPLAVRLRRDFGAILGLIRAHALLHRATRPTDEQGRIVATADDYAMVRELVADLVSDGISATLRPETRETVETVATLAGDTDTHVSITQLADALQMDKSAISRRVRVAIDKGYLRNDEDRRGRPSKLALGDPLPEDVELLPSSDEVRECCTVASESGGINTPADDDVERAERLAARHGDVFEENGAPWWRSPTLSRGWTSGPWPRTSAAASAGSSTARARGCRRGRSPGRSSSASPRFEAWLIENGYMERA